MKYFYFQMLKDKKIIIHKTDGKTFIPITGRSYRTNSPCGFRLSFSHFVCNPSCFCVICKTRKQNFFPLENVVIQHFNYPPSPLPLLCTARRLQEESAACCLSPPVCSTSTGPNAELRVEIYKLKRGLVLSHTICTLRWRFQNNTHFEWPKTP